MAELFDILSKLKHKGVSIVLDDQGSNLKLRGDLKVLTDADKKEIVAHKAELLDFFKAQKSIKKSIKKAEVSNNGYLLSSNQKNLWVLAQDEGSSSAYNMPFRFDFTESIDARIIIQAIQGVVKRHEILRTTFKEVEGVVKQFIKNENDGEINVELIDFSNRENPEEAVDDFIHNDGLISFDLENGPLIRAALLKKSETETTLYYNLHHIISDGWSMNVLFNEVQAFAEAIELGQEVNLPELTIQYKDFAEWQLNNISDEGSKEHNYWSAILKKEIPQLNLPSRLKRPAVKSYNGRLAETYLSESLSQQFKSYAKETGNSLFSLLLATSKVLLSRYTNEKDIVVGTPVAGRNRFELENQIGLFVNTVVLRNEINPNDTFKTVVGNINQSTVLAMSNQDYPFSGLVEKYDVSNDVSRSAFFDIMVSLENISEIQVSPNLQDSEDIKDVGKYTSKFDMNITFQERGRRIFFEINYNSDVYEFEMIQQFMKHFKTIAEGLLHAPNKPIKAVEFLSDEETKEQLILFNNTKVDFPQTDLITVFKSQVERTPNNTALVFQDQSLTYQELDLVSDRFASVLVNEIRIQQGDYVGIKLDRSEWLMISILGVLKAGASYVPIDPESPQERISFIEEDTGMSFCIDQSALEFVQKSLNDLDVIELANNRTQDSILYVMYTSGSTGKPKGVEVFDKGAIRLVKGQNYIELLQSDILLSTGAFPFDATTFEYWGMLLNGGKLILCSKSVLLDAERLKTEIASQKVNKLWMTSGWFNQLVDEDASFFSDLECLIIGGDVLSKEHVQKVLSASPNLKLKNAYGPTENTTFSTLFDINGTYSTLPIGKPISNSTCYILNDSQQLMVKGAIGEIYVGGEGLAKGYLNRPELTANSFVPHPFAEGELLYRTGDLGYWNPQGQLEFSGRKDSQVKIRGNRVEIGEIEYIISSHESINDAVIAVVELNDGIKELAAYYTATEEMDVVALRSYLKALMPSFMLPTYFIQLEKLPLNANGKVDKKSLPHPSNSEYSTGVDYVAPTSELEITQAKIWESILNRNRVGLNDDFFDLGGHSLKATRLLSEYHKAFNVKLSIKDIFSNPLFSDQSRLLRNGEVEAFISIPQVAESESYIASDAQYRMWVLNKFEEAEGAYNMPFQIKLEGNYDVEVFKSAVLSTIDRHEILRTRFIEVEDELHQVIVPSESINFRINYRDFSLAENAEAEAQDYIASDSFKGFDLEHGPLIRASLIQTGEEQYIFYYNLHHIIADGWSMDVLGRDVQQTYDAFISGRISPLKPLSIQYKDYAQWQRDQVSSSSYHEAKAYWTSNFSSEVPKLDLPDSKVRPVFKTYNGRELKLQLSNDVREQLTTFGRNYGGSAFMTLLASWNVMLHRYSGEKEIVIGTPVSGREHSDLKDQIGFYVNTLALKNDIMDSESFVDHYESVQRNTLAAFTHQLYPFDRLVDDLNLAMDPSRSALFDIFISYLNVSAPRLKSSKTKVIQDLGPMPAKFDLSITFEEYTDGLDLTVNFNTDVYTQELIEGLMVHYERLLGNLLKSPTDSVGSFDYLSEQERFEQLVSFNSTEVAYPESNIIKAFELQVESTPDNIAVVCEDRQFTYSELNELSNQFARFLQSEYAVSKGDFVGIKLDRTEWMIVSVLGTLKAGATYVPIDPEYPQERIDHIESDSSCKVCITASVVQEFKGRVTEYDSSNVHTKIAPGDLAYIIYTSGSTGLPKGVEIQHKNAISFIQWCQDEFKESDFDTVFFVTSICFDLSIFEVFYTLSVGKKIEILQNGLAIPDHLNTEEKILLNTVPSVVGELLALDINWKPISVLNMAGEEIPQDYLPRLHRLVDEIRNLYGPSEDTTYSTFVRLQEGGTYHIGKPIHNTQVYLLNESKSLNAKGTVGEICLGGAGLASGYLNRPELTKASFIDHPFKDGERLYKTGDLAKFLPNGELVLLGRKDHQVKIRGYRIELGEVETQIKQINDVREVAVLNFTINGQNELAAYLVANSELDSSSLRNKLKEKLPHYMVPSYFVQVDQLPRTANGKLDRKGLPNPVDNSSTISKEVVRPETKMQAWILEIWQNILQNQSISIEEDFFAVGGHSLKATRLLSEYHKAFNVKLSLKQLFMATNIRKQEALIMSSMKDNYEEIPLSEKMESYPLTDAQYGIWLQSKLDENSIAYNMPAQLELDQSTDFECLERAIDSTIERHEVLRTVFKETGQGEVRQYVVSAAAFQFKLEYVDYTKTTNAGDFISKELELGMNTSFDLENGPLIRATMYRLKDKNVLCFNMHHIISDGWSMNVLREDVLSFYNAYRSGTSPEIQELRIQYKDYAVWQQSKLESEEFQKAEDYWLTNLSGNLPKLDLPSRIQRPKIKTLSGRVLSMPIAAETKKAITAHASSKGGTLFMGLQTAWNVLMYRYTGQKDIVIGTPIAGRNHKDLENQIGFYLNTVVLRNQLDPEDSFDQSFEKVKNTVLDAFNYQDYPINRLIEKLDILKDVSRSPLFDMMLSVQNMNEISEGDADVYGEVKRLEDIPAKFDLDVKFEEVGDHMIMLVNFNTDVYEEDRVITLMKHFNSLLTKLYTNTDEKVGFVDFLEDEERNLLINGFNKTKADYTIHDRVISLFEKQSEETPGQTAIKYKADSLTYLELNNLANDYAQYLCQVCDITHTERVIVSIRHSLELMPVLLAVMKTGALYVPIDPTTPNDRIKLIQEDSGSKLIINEDELRRMKHWIAREMNEVVNLERVVNDEVEFIIYTSGSTGMPKGTLLKASSINNRLNWMWKNYPFSEGEVSCAKTSISFVDHIWEFFGPLLKGVPTVFFDKSEVLNIPDFIRTLGREKVSRIVLVPTLLKAMLSHRELFGKHLKHLNFWVSSGEALTESLTVQFYETHRRSNVRMLNVYGSTEVTADATYFDTYEEYNKYKPFKLFEASIKDHVDDLIEIYDSSAQTTFKSLDQLIEEGSFSDISGTSKNTIDTYSEFLESEVLPNVVNVGDPKFIGHMTGPVPRLFRELGMLVTTLNQNQVKIETSMVATLIENQVIGIFHNTIYQREEKFYDQYVQNPNTALGVITNGGTMSNLMALSYALNSQLGPKGNFRGITEEGLVKALAVYGYEKVALIGSTWCHYSFGKGLKMLGLGRDSFVEMDFEHKSDQTIKAELAEMIKNLRSEKALILGMVGIAGTTESGHVEPLVTLGEVAREFNIHYHVDAAFGGSYLMDDELRVKLSGIEMADSVSICAHKQFYLPIGLSICLFQDPEFASSSENNTHYQAREGSHDLGKYTIEGSKNFMSLLLHGGFKIFGRQGFGEVVRQNYNNAQKFAALIDANPAFELSFPPELNIVLYRYIPLRFRGKATFTDAEIEVINGINVELQTRIFAEGESFVSHTKVKIKGTGIRNTMLRSVLMNPYTSQRDLMFALEEQERIAADIEHVQYVQREHLKARNVSIGRPLENVEIFILDELLKPVPIGVVGEICVSGDCVSAGYTNQEIEANDSFVPNPYREGEQLFRTGDLGSWMPDGTIEHFGRSDDQVKIRGNRIELGEIQSLLDKHETVASSAVKVIDENIIAYVQGEGNLDATSLRSFLKSKLPDYMLPTYFIRLKEMPLTNSGKIDKKSLPGLDQVTPMSSNTYVPPSTEVQKKLVLMWENVLNQAKVGVTDDFFELGGHSLSAVRLINQLEQEFHLKLEIKNLLENPTIQYLSEEIERIEWLSEEKKESFNIIEI